VRKGGYHRKGGIKIKTPYRGYFRKRGKKFLDVTGENERI